MKNIWKIGDRVPRLTRDLVGDELWSNIIPMTSSPYIYGHLIYKVSGQPLPCLISNVDAGAKLRTSIGLFGTRNQSCAATVSDVLPQPAD